MGRRDAVQFTLEWAAEARRLGAEVTFEPGWETRGNGMSADYEGMEVHHTGYGSSAANPFPAKNTLIGGRPDLGGPLTNVAGPYCTVERPWLHVVAAHPSNNAGASGRASKNLGPLPISLVFNKHVFALEIDYGGNVAMALGQRLAALIFSRAGVNVLRRSTEYVRAHAETSVTGKWDPGYQAGRTIDMAAFRRDAAAIAPGGDWFDMATKDDLRAVIWEFLPPEYDKSWLRDILRRVQSMHAGRFGKVSAGRMPDGTTIDNGFTAGDLSWLDEKLKTLPGEVSAGSGPVSDDQLARVLTQPEVAAAFGEAVAAAIDRRARDGDPATGPVS